MKNRKLTNWMSALGITLAASFTACSDWTENKSIDIETPSLEQLYPEEYAKYLENLVAYKESDHKVTYAWFDNSQKVPFSRVHHIVDAPDSLDVIALMYPAQLASFELEEMQQVRRKGTKVVYTISFDQIAKEYDEQVKDGVLEPGNFSDYLSSELTKQLGYAPNFDGMIASYKGTNPIYLSPEEKAAALALQNSFFGAIQTWKSNHTSAWLSFQGYPENLIEQTILAECKHIILATDKATDVAHLSLAARLAMAAQEVPTDRFVVVVSTTSLDTSDKNTGYFGSDRSITEAAYWATVREDSYVRAGIAVDQVQRDYFTSRKIYGFTREAINIMNPAN